ncbi:MAG TPA: alpha/beta hydrolase [Anaerolineales bacterium]|nr:alpha/beta hydrolase [Anaerolineales bacterium]
MTTKTSHKILNWLKRAFVRVSILIFVLAMTGMIYQTAATESDQRKYPPPGVLVNVNGYKMHIYCIGQGSPTIILDHVGDGSSVDWALIQPKLAEHTRVCAYDRAGFGWSDSNPAPRTLEGQVNELHGLLQGANEHGPFILVGHSYGARVSRVYAAKYPDQVAGMVLMDAGILADDPRYPAEMQSDFETENNMLRAARWLSPFGLVRLTKPLMELPTFDLPEEARTASASFSFSTRYFQSLIAQSHSMPTVLREEREVTSLGDIPLLVLVSTEPDDATHKVWKQANIEMAALSTNGSYRIVDGATHMSLAYRKSDAQVCADGILEVLQSVRMVQALQ